MEDKTKKIFGLVAIALIAGAGGYAFGGANVPAEIIKETITKEKIIYEDNPIDAELQAENEAFKLEIAEYEAIEPEVIEVDNGNLDFILEHIYDNDGNVEYLLDDLDDDELDQIVERVAFVNEIKALAIDELNKELADELDKEVVDIGNNETLKLDEDDIERIRIKDDADEIEVLEIDFEDGDAELKLRGRFEQDDIKFNFEAVISFRDGEIDEIESIDVSLRE